MFSRNCHLHFWQNDRDLLRATAVTLGWNGYRNKCQHRKLTPEKKILSPFLQGFEPASRESGALITELSPLPSVLALCHFSVLSTTKGHLRTIQLSHKQMHIPFPRSVHKINPYTNIKQSIHTQTPNASFSS